jgi:hypothetical protein
VSTELYDDHGNPAIWNVCDACGLPSLCLCSYEEASGPCELDPDYAERLAADFFSDRPRAIPGGAALLGEGGPLCGNCVATMAFCADKEACYRAQGLAWPPPPPPEPSPPLRWETGPDGQPRPPGAPQPGGRP